MKTVGKIIYALWSAIIIITLLFYCFSCYMGYKVKEIAVSSIESQGEDFAKYDNIISENDYIKLWHETPDNASYDRIEMNERSMTQSYTVSNPYILAFKDKNSFFSLNKIGYIYNIKIKDSQGNEVESVASENSSVILDIDYDGADFKIERVFYDNDFNEYNVNAFNGLALLIVLLINSVARNIRYFDFCVKHKKKRKLLLLIQPYFFVVLIATAMVFDALPYALILGMAEEFIFIFISKTLKAKNKKA
ncbi:MAG: hypothetical protein U0L17_00880 [Acutalibacteraceae bacterium]|nr:hypothetical protein [Acutalibacteraceae bacterium]